MKLIDTKKFTKWYPLYTYTYSCDSFLVQCRKNKTSGYIEFSTTKVSAWSHHIPLGLNAQEQFKKVMEDE